ncbi:putative nucleic acid-binding protein [Halanaerobium saccharolyticum]|uniref:Putative nucleic acid-binding protein n=1 Tax=Halanaerobium saccharolyticum TaxID=43595 RepID=A0A4R7ZAS3_9FIRM|nr:hypothetical protein [Halanaerobium saccharolyticum]RAK08568.1 putative nucleic acid-binding protein [Halanaerobium saccharolyticum]TDW07288.1 putative nucleic acid-binding protein [Halanaerobium saccharolyticum]TDX60120.1 putative nucleic acid-binding protein [Halanaerobium saccharolyticum]
MSKSQLFVKLTNETIFVDTSAWFALLSKNDKNHQKIKNNSLPFKFIKLINKSMMIKKIHIEAKTEKNVIKILENYKDQRFSYVDATSFAVMNRLELKYALSLDRHFAAAGFIIP